MTTAADDRARATMRDEWRQAKRRAGLRVFVGQKLGWFGPILFDAAGLAEDGVRFMFKAAMYIMDCKSSAFADAESRP